MNQRRAFVMPAIAAAGLIGNTHLDAQNPQAPHQLDILWQTRFTNSTYFQAYGSPVFSLSPDEALVGAPSRFGVGMRVFGASDGQLKATWPFAQLEYPVYATAFSPDGRFLATCGGDLYSSHPRPRIVLRRVSDGQIESMVVDDTEWNTGVPIMRTLAFSPDGKILATGGNTRLVALWSVPDLALLGVLDGHEWGGVNCLSFSPDGSLLASGGADTTVRIWRLADRALLHTLPGDADFFSVFSLAFSPDGSLLASGTYGLNVENFPGIGFVPPAQLVARHGRATFMEPNQHQHHDSGVGIPAGRSNARRGQRCRRRA